MLCCSELDTWDPGPRAQGPGPETAVPLENCFIFSLGCPDTASLWTQLWQELCFLKVLSP